MNRERWEAIESLLDRVLDLRPEERDAFLDAACAGDQDLRARIEALLRADEHAGTFLDMPALEQSAPLVAALYEDPMAGRPIGAYRILRESGRGGMGVVYLAERADGQFQQQVALKLIKRGMDSDAILQRFLHERQILARLQHPNVARLLDGGVTEEGQPYFAMEHVDGSPLTTYCDQHRLGVEARLDLFLTACAAVQYAHQNLVVHRDLKPSNMLVTESGELKLVDFGIAKLLGGDEGGTLTTEMGSRPMTPEYAPPEQLRGEPVTTAADVYALGVVLYELLAGRRPHEMTRGDPETMVRLAATEPVRPSMAVVRPAPRDGSAAAGQATTPGSVGRDRGMRPERLRRRLAGDLDTICLKALQREPERRYASVQALLDDVQRHLSGLPVLARPDTLAYRASRFVGRHRIGVTAAAAIAALLIGFSAVTAVQSARIRAQADRIGNERDRAEEVKGFLLKMFEATNPLFEVKGDVTTRLQMLERGLERVDRELAGQPEIQAEMLMAIGNAYDELGRSDLSVPLLERALALRRAAFGPEHVLVARTMGDLGVTRCIMGDYATCEQLQREALDMRRRLLGEEHRDVAASLKFMGEMLNNKGDVRAAEEYFRAALAMRRRLLGSEHEDTLSSMSSLAGMLSRKGDFDGAESLHRDALALRRKTLGDEHPHVANSLASLGSMSYDKGDYDAAESFYRQAIAIRRRLFGEEHPSLAASITGLGRVLLRKGDLDVAEPLLREALAMRRKLLGDEHDDVGLSLTALGELHQRKGDLAEAARLTREALDLYRRRLPERHPRIAAALVSLGRIHIDQGRWNDAEPLLREALEVCREVYGATHARTLEVESLLGEAGGPPERQSSIEK